MDPRARKRISGDLYELCLFYGFLVGDNWICACLYFTIFRTNPTNLKSIVDKIPMIKQILPLQNLLANFEKSLERLDF